MLGLGKKEIKMDSPQKGDRVRAYDFAGTKDCYVEGEVVGFENYQGCPRYRVQIERRVFAGRQVDFHREFPEGFALPPVNGTRIWFGQEVTNNVEIV